MYEFKDPQGIGRMAVGACWAFLAVVLAKGAADLNTVRVLGGLGGAIAQEATLRGADGLTAGTALIYLLGYVVTGVIVLRWIFITNRNAQTWSPHVGITPGWNVGWFFVPVASLFKPFEGVRETYQASVDPDEPGSVPVPAVMRLWWGAWLVGGFLSYVILFFGANPATPASLIATSWVEVIVAAIIVGQTVALIAVIRRTTGAQVARLASAT